MTDIKLRRLFSQILALAVPVPVALFGACGGSTASSGPADRSSGGAGSKPALTGGVTGSPGGGPCTTCRAGSSSTGGDNTVLGSGGATSLGAGRPGIAGTTTSAGATASTGGASPSGGNTGMGGGHAEAGGSSANAGGAEGEDPCAPPPAGTGGVRPFCAPPTCMPLREMSDAGLDGGLLTRPKCDTLCQSPGFLSCQIVTSKGQKMAKCYHDCTGRRPQSLVPAAFDDGSEIGIYFAQMAHLEAASVAAFRILARELRQHEAPPLLVREARRAARDELRHTRLSRELGRRHGAHSAPPKIGAIPERRSLEAIAVENAVEGCVRETFGALFAAWQARKAADPDVRRAFRTIARDEARHAALAWQIAEWAEPRLDAAARQRVAERRRAAVNALETEIGGTPSDLFTSVTGTPPPAVARTMLVAMRERLWSRRLSSC